MKIAKKQLETAIGLLIVFILYTISLSLFDVQKIGPQHSEVGFSTINQYVFQKIGTSEFWYQVTEILGIFPLIIVGYFALTSGQGNSCARISLCWSRRLLCSF